MVLSRLQLARFCPLVSIPNGHHSSIPGQCETNVASSGIQTLLGLHCCYVGHEKLKEFNVVSWRTRPYHQLHPNIKSWHSQHYCIEHLPQQTYLILTTTADLKEERTYFRPQKDEHKSRTKKLYSQNNMNPSHIFLKSQS